MNEETQVNETESTTQTTDSQTTSVDSEVSSGEIETETAEGTEVESSSEEESETPEEILASSIEEKYGDMLDKFIDGNLTEEDYKALNKKGISREEFNIIAEATRLTTEKNDQTLYSFVGGHEQYKQLQEFANSNLSQEEKQLYNDAIGHDMKLARLVVLGLKAQMEQSEGYTPAMSIEGNSTAVSNESYDSRDAYYADKRNRLYGKDKAFTANVDAKRNASGF